MSEARLSATIAGDADSGLRCPVCDYNLTGLLAPRCPECGSPFDRAILERDRHGPPRIAFEQSVGWLRPFGFALTWGTVLLVPWIFARQAVARISTRAGLGFGAVCFASTGAALLIEAEFAVYAGWIAAAFACVAVQTLLLALLDSSPGGRLAAMRFWLGVSGYTSAVMVTEVLTGPPLVLFSDLVRFAFGAGSWIGGAITVPGHQLSGMYPLVEWMYDGSWSAALPWAQILMWIAGFACCFYARERRMRRPVWRAAISGLAIGVLLLMLYGAAVQYVGFTVYEAVVVR